MQDEPERWGVVGGGLLGMTLALRLAQRGKRVTLFESADHLGGLADAWRLGDVTWDRHYHVILLSDRHLRALLAELGLADEVAWAQTRSGFFVDGRLHSLSNTLEFLRFPPLGLWDKLRLGFTIWYASRVRDGRRLEQLTAVDWLRRLSGRRTVERIWLPLLRAKLGERAERASAAFIWAIIARMYAARRTGLKKEMFGYVRGGYVRILERFAAAVADAGVQVRLGCPVRRVDADYGVVRIDCGDGPPAEVAAAVLTLPGPVAARVCPVLADDERSRLTGIEYQGIVCASLLLRRPLGPFYVTNITDAWVPFTAVIETSTLVEREAFGGNALVYLPRYVPPDDPFFRLSDAEVRERFEAALGRMYPHFDRADVLAFRVSRVPHVLAVPTLHYSDRLPPVATSVPGVFVLNSAHIVNGTLNANETVQLAEASLDTLLAHRPAAGARRPAEGVAR